MDDFIQLVEFLRNSGEWSDTRILNALVEGYASARNPMILSMANVQLEERIKKMLDEICMSPKSKGYDFWVEAIKMYIKSGKTLGIGEIYNELAGKRKKTYSSVSSAMNKSAKVAFSKCSQAIGQRIFGKSVYYTLKEDGFTNKEFLARIAQKLQ